MTIMDPKAAAEAIKDAWESNPAAPEPGERHRLTFLEEVCEHLGVEASTINVSHVAHLMAKAGIEHHQPEEYPKALNEADKTGRLRPVLWPQDHPLAGTAVVFANAEEETAYGKPKN